MSPVFPPAKTSSKSSIVIFGIWFAVVSGFSALLVALHAVPLPASDAAPVVKDGNWRATHALGADCGCSSAVADALLARSPRNGWKESVILVGHQPSLAQQLTAAGFAVEQLSAEDFTRRTGLHGVPWLVVHTPDGETVYSGGYAPSRPGIDARTLFDTSIMDRVCRGETVAAYPSFGCATSQALRARLDPLSLK
ncbi:MAG: hypothetical protein QM760_02430 [Nibricoccus sp.]